MNHTALRSANILVLHPDPLLCAGLVAALRQQPGFEVFVDGVDLLTAVEARIDVVIADYANAIRLAEPAVRAAQRPLAGARILTLTANDREADIRRAIEAGVQGYLVLGGPLGELIEGVTAVAGGTRYLCRDAAQRIADSLTRASLTAREIEVLRLVANGECNKAIARRLHIEVGTVKSHMSAIMTKLGATSRTHAAGIAATRGLIEERTHVQPATLSPRAACVEPRTQFA